VAKFVAAADKERRQREAEETGRRAVELAVRAEAQERFRQLQVRLYGSVYIYIYTDLCIPRNCISG